MRPTNVQLLSCVTHCLLQETSLLTLWQVGFENKFLPTHGGNFPALLVPTLTLHATQYIESFHHFGL
jgi:hypothetical protein